MYRRMHPDNHAAHNNLMQEKIIQQLNSGQSTLYGCQLTYYHLKMCAIPISGDRMWVVMNAIDPEGFADREWGKLNRPLVDFKVPGYGRILSVDGHHKLSRFGFKIYAGIDACSRYNFVLNAGYETHIDRLDS
ncbi:hypothetical protein EDC01DRAFT_636041 [Geopyxis carbonaria]|nr:hypothetical protein EDC01DRAFT_636041 [Geopyxis carbonaria]